MSSNAIDPYRTSSRGTKVDVCFATAEFCEESSPKLMDSHCWSFSIVDSGFANADVAAALRLRDPAFIVAVSCNVHAMVCMFGGERDYHTTTVRGANGIFRTALFRTALVLH